MSQFFHLQKKELLDRCRTAYKFVNIEYLINNIKQMSEQQPLSVIFFGIQGAGKGTQAKLLRDYLDEHTNSDTLYLETGQLLRDFMAKEGHTQKLVNETISNGDLLPSFMPVYVLGREMVKGFSGNEHLIFDGATRRANQTVMLDSMLRFYKRDPYHLVLIGLSEESAMERLKERGRSDDTEEKIKKRIAWSKEHMDSVMKQFEGFDCSIHSIDGEPSIEEIHKDILEKLNLA